MIERKTLSSKICYILIIAVVLLFSLSCLLPLIYTLALSLSSKEAVAAGQVGFWPVGFTLVNYKEIMKDIQFFRSFLTAVIRVVLATVIALGVMIPASYALAKSKKDFAPRNVIMWICVFCMMFSGGLIPWYMTMKNYGLINSVFGLAVCGGLPIYNMILMINFFESIPKELEEAAIVDGAGPWKILGYTIEGNKIVCLIEEFSEEEDSGERFLSLNEIRKKEGFREIISGIWIWNYQEENYIYPKNYSGCCLMEIYGVKGISYEEIDRVLLKYKREKFFGNILEKRNFRKKKSQLMKKPFRN